MAGDRPFPADGDAADADAVGADAELAHGRVVAAGPGLDDGQRPAHGAVVAGVAKRDHVVGQVGDGELRQPARGELVGRLVGSEQADALPGEPLRQGVGELAEAGVVHGGHLQVQQAVDGDPARPGAFDGVQQVVHPFVNVDIHWGAVHDLDAWAGQRPAQAGEHPVQLGRVFLQRGDDAALAVLGFAVDEMQCHEGLARAGGARDHRGRTGPQPAVQHQVQRRDPGRGPVIAEQVVPDGGDVGQPGE